MFKITDIQTLGTDYTVSNQEGKILKNIQVIPLTELYETAIGPYTEDFGSYEAYVERFAATLSGLDGLDPYSILWFSTTEEEVALSDIIEHAIKNGYDKIILEHLDELE